MDTAQIRYSRLVHVAIAIIMRHSTNKVVHVVSYMYISYELLEKEKKEM